MRPLWPGFLLAFALGSAAACSSAEDPATTAPDAEVGSEGGVSAEGGSASEAGSPQTSDGGDAGPSGDILGTLTTGACGTVKAQVTAAGPSLENNVLVFVAGERYEKDSLSAGGKILFDTPNAGGSSTESEVMSFEVLRHCEGATLLKTETEIAFQPVDDAGANSITDLLVEIGGKKVGVSVTRAYKPPTVPLTDADVRSLLVKKLEGVNRSSERVKPEDKWVKQILHVFSVNQAATEAVTRVWATLDAGLRADTIVLVTQTQGGGFVYCDPDPALGSECPAPPSF